MNSEPERKKKTLGDVLWEYHLRERINRCKFMTRLLRASISDAEQCLNDVEGKKNDIADKIYEMFNAMFKCQKAFEDTMLAFYPLTKYIPDMLDEGYLNRDKYNLGALEDACAYVEKNLHEWYRSVLKNRVKKGGKDE